MTLKASYAALLLLAAVPGVDGDDDRPRPAIPAPIPGRREDSAPGCPSWTFAESPLGAPLEHTDEVCNRAMENDPDRVGRLRQQMRRSIESGNLRQLKDDKTWVCPSDDAAFEDEGEALTGPPSVWLFRNEASTPVSVGWIDPHSGNAEVSAFHPEISPPHLDPRAVIQPGDWRAVDVYLGHNFHIRELRVEGADLVPGRVLVRHRPGPIPIKNRFAGPDFTCPIPALVDPNPHTEKPDPKFSRTPYHYKHKCNTLHRVFTNRVGCPVDVYYGGVAGEGHTASSTSGKNARSYTLGANETETKSPNLSNTCFERFKFHLGINPAHSIDYDDKWDSPVAFEATYITHKFVARLRHDPTVVVDEVVIDRTVVRDCPKERRKAKAAAGVNEAVKAGVGRAEVDPTGEHKIVLQGFDAVAASAMKVMGENATNCTALTEAETAPFTNEAAASARTVVSESS